MANGCSLRESTFFISVEGRRESAAAHVQGCEGWLLIRASGSGCKDLAERLAGRVLPRFAQIISPGCGQRGLVPMISPDDVKFDPSVHLNDLYYPAGSVELHLDIGTADDVPEGCYNGGIRELQALAYETLTNAPRSRYLVKTYEEAGHNLLGSHGNALHAKLSYLVDIHFFGRVFKNGFE